MYQIRITTGPQAGQVLQLVSGYTYVIGRGTEAHLSIPDDKTLSRVHAEVVAQGQGWLLRNKSNFGSLVGGQVIQGDAPLAPGATFQVGGTTLVLEAAAGTGTVPTTVQPGAPAGAAAGGGAAGGGAAGGGAGVSGKDAKAAAAAGAAALGAAAAKLGTGPVSIQHSGPGFPFGDLIKGGLRIALANKMASLALFFPIVIMVILQIVVNVGVQVGLPNAVMGIIALVAMIFGLVCMLYSLAMPQLMCNYMAGVKEYQASGTTFGIGQLIKFENLVPRYLTMIGVGVGFMCCVIPGMLLFMAVPLIVDRPNTPFVDALKGSLAWSKKNIVPLLILFIVCGIVNFIGQLLCGVGLLITQPTVVCAMWLAYALKRDEIKAAAAEAGINLA
jgi:hypothetical protein